jgi:hypothetical protein
MDNSTTSLEGSRSELRIFFLGWAIEKVGRAVQIEPGKLTSLILLGTLPWLPTLQAATPLRGSAWVMQALLFGVLPVQ